MAEKKSKVEVKKQITATQNKIREAVKKEGHIKKTKPLREKLASLFKDAKTAGFTTAEIDKMKFRGMPSREDRRSAVTSLTAKEEKKMDREIKKEIAKEQERRDKPHREGKKSDRELAKKLAKAGGTGSDPTFSIFEMMNRPNPVKPEPYLSRTRYSPITGKMSKKYKKSNPLGNNKGGIIDLRKSGMFK
jgi:hypothetical protein